MKIVLTVASFAAVGAFLAFLLILPQAHAVRELRAQVLANRIRIELQIAQIGEFRAAADKLSLIRDSLPVVQELFPVRENSAILVEGLEDVLMRSEVQAAIAITDKLETDPGGRGGGTGPETVASAPGLHNVEEVPYILRASGTYRNFTDLLLYIENLPFVTELWELNFNAQSQQTGEGLGVVNNGLADAQLKGIFFLKR